MWKKAKIALFHTYDTGLDINTAYDLFVDAAKKSAWLHSTSKF